jgi:hypothetical protein
VGFIQVEYPELPCHIEECDFVVVLVEEQGVFFVDGFVFEGFGDFFVDLGVDNWLQGGCLGSVLNVDGEIDTVDVLEDIDQIAHYFVFVLCRIVEVLQKTVRNWIFGLELKSFPHRQMVAVELARVVLVFQQHELAVEGAESEIDE